ncbi:c-type cytochrome biogenesis protein CcmI [uncultured Dechloromonas sp.]|uniref:c-type cytochrome biogenesis protein CcmI n=1 Tax=uncultured Dechloromonas sp. TaxID=171719 RepID=UPI0025D2B560|nr:c-type cytochrome biogenesis protein CcmI [uncultured Dechloromonas sp.]
MSVFLVVGGLLLVGVLVALLYPLLKRQPAQREETTGQRELNLIVLREQLAEVERDIREGRIGEEGGRQSREELERRVLEYTADVPAEARSGSRKVKLAIALGVAFPVAIGALYWTLGAPGSVVPGKQAAAGKDGQHALSPEQITAMVERLSLRLQENPNDGAGWLMLARSYAVLGRYPESTAAFGRAVALLPPDAQNFADFADIIAMSQGKRLAGDPERLVQRALEIDPRNVKALALSGTIAFDRQDYGQAIREWQKVLALVPEDSAAAAGIQGSIRDAENRMAISGKQATDSGKAAGDTPAAAAKLSGTVELDPKLRSAMKPGDTLFVFARAVNGPKMPVAMLRAKADDMPINFTLDDSMAMAPQFKLSTVGQVVVGARISKSGDALARPGDLEGLSSPVSVGGGNVKIVINSIVQ